MSPLSRFMRAATEILNSQDAKRLPPAPLRPPVFVRTNYLFIEIDEATEEITKLNLQVKEARLNHNVAETKRLTLEVGKKAFQVVQLCSWANEQFEKEASNG